MARRWLKCDRPVLAVKQISAIAAVELFPKNF